MPGKNSLPSLPRLRLDSKLYLPLLVILLVVAAFLIGVLLTKVQYLEKGQTTTIGAENLAPNEAPPDVATEPVDVGEGHLPILGQKDAKVTIVEFSDFQCPFCQSFWEQTIPQIKKEYVDTGKVKFAYRHYPLDSIHPNAQKAAEASECANEQGNFWDYHDKLFENQSEWEGQTDAEASDSFVKYANELGLNGASLKTCLDSDKYAKAVQEDVDAGSDAGVTGTPATYVNGLLISGAQPFSAFKTVIDKELEK